MCIVCVSITQYFTYVNSYDTVMVWELGNYLLLYTMYMYMYMDVQSCTFVYMYVRVRLHSV